MAAPRRPAAGRRLEDARRPGFHEPGMLPPRLDLDPFARQAFIGQASDFAEPAQAFSRVDDFFDEDLRHGGLRSQNERV